MRVQQFQCCKSTERTEKIVKTIQEQAVLSSARHAQSPIWATGKRSIFARDIASILSRGWRRCCSARATLHLLTQVETGWSNRQGRWPMVFTIFSVLSVKLRHWNSRCTLLHTLLRSIKTDPSTVRQARKLYLLGGNFSEVPCYIVSFPCGSCGMMFDVEQEQR